MSGRPRYLGREEPWKITYLSLTGLLGDQTGAARELREAEDDELGRLHRGHPDLADDLTGVDALRRVGLAVALDVIRLIGGEAEEGTLTPFVDQEGGDGAPHLGL